MNRLASILYGLVFWLYLLARCGTLSAEEDPGGTVVGELLTMEGEILEVNELNEPAGSAVYSVRNFATGETLTLFADAYRTVIWSRERLKPVSEVLGGSKGTFLYQASSERPMPMLVFAKLSDSSLS